MPPISEKYTQLLQEAAVELKEILRSEQDEDGKLVQKGLLLYRQGLVARMKFEDDYVFASVQDVTPANVRLTLKSIGNSECSCPAEGFCRHQFATFFHAYSQIDSVANWVDDWRKPIKEKQTAQIWGLQRAKDLLKTTGSGSQPGYNEWITTFEESFDSIMMGQGRPRPYTVPDLFHVYKRRLKVAAPIEQEWKLLYLLVAYVFSFRKLLHLSHDLSFDEAEINRYYRHVFNSLMDDVEDLVKRLGVQALPFAFDEFIEKLKDDSSYILKGDLGLDYDRLYVYRTLWTYFFKKKVWREQELVKLEDLNEEEMPVLVARAHQYILLGEDLDAIQLIKSLGTGSMPYMLDWLEMFTNQRDWKRMEPFVEYFISLIRDYLTELRDTYPCMDFTKWALKGISPYCNETGNHDLFEKALVQTLPYSYSEYEDYLYRQKRFDKWGELHAYIGFTITSIPKDTIKEIQKEAPAVLLPLYHQSIQKHIELKNRGSYKEAVRELKKLRTIYKKLKRADDFETFMEALLDKTKRLRAFQEECQRGKLIHA